LDNADAEGFRGHNRHLKDSTVSCLRGERRLF
jgi:hypothetical protein